MNDESRGLAITRTRIVAAVRGYLDGEGFLEVETPILQPRYGGGFAEPFVTHSNELDADLYLRIADELYLKRLIVGGLEKVYELSKDFRNESTSYKHSPEFTQVEWYEAYADYRDTMERTEALVLAAAEAVGSTERDLPRPRPRPFSAVAARPLRRRPRGQGRLVARRGRAAREAGGGRRRHRPRPLVVAARRPRVLALRRAGARPADVRLRLAARALAVRTNDRRRRDARGEVRGGRRRDGVRECLQRAERCRASRRSASRCRRPSARPGRRSPSRAIPTSSRRCSTACRRPGAAGSASTG